MKNLALIFSIILMGFSANATSIESENNLRRGYDGNAYIFVEGDVEFSIFPDGQFDFVYVGPQNGNQVTISSPNTNRSFNSGYNYETYVQYDDYGAVIQVESVPIYYDYYGRITQAGNVDIQYNNRRIVRVGDLNVFYNNYGYFSHYTGFINAYNPYYVYRPWHVYYARPLYGHCIVYDMPYRRYYNPVRYSYHDHVIYYKNRHNVAYQNTRRDFYNPGSRVYDKRGRSSINAEYNPNRTNTMIASNNTRTNSPVRSNTNRSNEALNTNTRSNTVTRTIGTNSKGATSIDRNTRVENPNTTKSIRQNITPNTFRDVQSESVVRPNNTRTVSNNRAVQTQTRNVSNTNRSSSVVRSTTQAPRRETAHRNTIEKSSTTSRSSSSVNTSRGSSSREVGSRGRK